MKNTSVKSLLLIACGIVALDQATKRAVLHLLDYSQERVVIDGFFKFVHWGNTGAAWSLFRDNNNALAVVSGIALVALFFARRHFGSESKFGQLALGLMFGGIVGNLIDRVAIGHVVDFIYFHVITRSGAEAGFPAFNVADSAICVGVGILFLLSLKKPPVPEEVNVAPAKVDSEPPGNPS
jgi:signal peptidase II